MVPEKFWAENVPSQEEKRTGLLQQALGAETLPRAQREPATPNTPLCQLGPEGAARPLLSPHFRVLSTSPPYPHSPAAVLWGFSKQQLLEAAKEVSDAEGHQSIEHCNKGSQRPLTGQQMGQRARIPGPLAPAHQHCL